MQISLALQMTDDCSVKTEQGGGGSTLEFGGSGSRGTPLRRCQSCREEKGFSPRNVKESGALKD